MLICGEHDREDIAYQGRICPACTHVAKLEEEINVLKDRIAEAQVEIATLTDDLEQWQTQ